MDTEWLMPITAAFTAIATCIGFFITRADKRRETVDMSAIDILKQALADSQQRETDRKAELDALEEYCRDLTDITRRYREQLIAADKTPNPTAWPRRKPPRRDNGRRDP